MDGELFFVELNNTSDNKDFINLSFTKDDFTIKMQTKLNSSFKKIVGRCSTQFNKNLDKYMFIKEYDTNSNKTLKELNIGNEENIKIIEKNEKNMDRI